MSSARPSSRLARDVRTGAVLIAGLSAAVAVHAQNRIVYVDASAPIGGNGQSWQTAYNDLQVALLLTERPQFFYQPIEFRVAAGTYTPDLGLGYREMPFYVTQGDVIAGGYAGRSSPDPNASHPTEQATILSGDIEGDDTALPDSRDDNALMLVQVSPGSRFWPSPDTISTEFRNLELRGIDSAGSSYVLRGSGPAVLSRCRFLENRCNQLIGGGPTNLFGCVVEGNTTNYLMVGVESLVNCVVRGNTGHPEFSLIQMSTSSIHTSVVNSLLVDNSNCQSLLGGVEQLQLYRSTIAHNSVGWYILLTSSNTVRISNCIVALNTFSAGRSLLVGCSSLVLSGPNVFEHGPGEISPASYSTPCNHGIEPRTDPNPFVRFWGPDGNRATWRDNDYRPRPDGPAIDAADLTTSTTGYVLSSDAGFSSAFDVSGVPNSGVGDIAFADIGAVEYVPLTGQYCPADFNRSGNVSVQDVFDYLSVYFQGCP